MTCLLFAGDDYYPLGGASDLQGEYPSADAAVGAHDPRRFNYEGGWANVLDLSTLKIVKWFSRGEWHDGDPCEPPSCAI